MVGSSPILFKGLRWQEWNPSVHENSATSPVYITILLRNLTGDMFQRKGGWYPTPWRCTSFSKVHLAPSYCLWICYTPKLLSSITLPPFQAPLRSISKGAHKENAVNFDRLALVGWLGISLNYQQQLHASGGSGMSGKQEYGTCNTTMCQVSASLVFLIFTTWNKQYMHI